LFYRYKINDGETRARLRLEVTKSLKLIPDINGNMMTSEDKLAYLERCLPYLVTKFSDEQTLKILNLTEESFSAVCSHPRYELCSRIMEERFPAVPRTNLGLTVLLVSTANNLGDLTNLLRLLLYNLPPTTEMKITETFYMILNDLALFRDEFKMPWRLGYLLYHALALQFNNCSVQSRELTNTAEQSRIINMDLACLTSRDTVRIMAYAGTGKTTTLKSSPRGIPS